MTDFPSAAGPRPGALPSRTRSDQGAGGSVVTADKDNSDQEWICDGNTCRRNPNYRKKPDPKSAASDKDKAPPNGSAPTPTPTPTPADNSPAGPGKPGTKPGTGPTGKTPAPTPTPTPTPTPAGKTPKAGGTDAVPAKDEPERPNGDKPWYAEDGDKTPGDSRLGDKQGDYLRSINKEASGTLKGDFKQRLADGTIRQGTYEQTGDKYSGSYKDGDKEFNFEMNKKDDKWGPMVIKEKGKDQEHKRFELADLTASDKQHKDDKGNNVGDSRGDKGKPKKPEDVVPAPPVAPTPGQNPGPTNPLQPIPGAKYNGGGRPGGAADPNIRTIPEGLKRQWGAPDRNKAVRPNYSRLAGAPNAAKQRFQDFETKVRNYIYHTTGNYVEGNVNDLIKRFNVPIGFVD